MQGVFSREGAGLAPERTQSNNPSWLGFGDATELVYEARTRGMDGDFAIRFLEHMHFSWFAVFDSGADDARVYLGWQDDEGNERSSLVSLTLAFFLWDFAQSALAWWSDRAPQKVPVRATEIGLARVAPA